MHRFSGVICPILTPFDGEDRVDEAALDELVDFLVDKGIHGIMTCGSTGEGLLLSLAERKQVTERVVRRVNGRCVVMAHIGCMNTPDTIELARHAEEAGADALSAIVPFFFSYDKESLLMHFARIGEAAPDLPFFGYLFPGNAKNDISPELLPSLRDVLPNLAGLKVSNPDLLRLSRYLELGGDDLVILSGVDGLMLPSLSLGAQGQVSGHSNVFPEPFCRLYEAFQNRNLAAARKEQRRINRIRVVLKDGLHPAYFKAGLCLRGLRGGRVRSPMRELTDSERKQLEEELQALDLI